MVIKGKTALYRIRDRWDNMSKKQKALATLGVCVMLVSVVSASYFFVYSKGITGLVTGGENSKINLVFDIDNFAYNVANESGHNETLTLNNADGPRLMSLEMNVNKTNLDAECPNYENDCTIRFLDESGSVIDGEFTLQSGEHAYTLETTCHPRSCPQEIGIDISISEI